MPGVDGRSYSVNVTNQKTTNPETSQSESPGLDRSPSAGSTGGKNEGVSFPTKKLRNGSTKV